MIIWNLDKNALLSINHNTRLRLRNMEDVVRAHRDAYFQEKLESLKASMTLFASLLEQALINTFSEGPSNKHVTQTITPLKERVGEQGQNPQHNPTFV